MKSWTRAIGRRTRCGKCGAVIPAGEPLIAWRIVGVQRALWRCVGCAEAGEPPPDLPTFEVVRAEPKRGFVHLGMALEIPAVDFKRRASGDPDEVRTVSDRRRRG